MKRVKKVISYLLIVAFIFNLFLNNAYNINAENTTAKELPNAVTDVKIYSNADSIFVEPDQDGVRKVFKNIVHSFVVDYDLHETGNTVQNGDFFNINIPAPTDVQPVVFELEDDETKVKIATVTLTSNGESQGGTAKVVFQNLDEYKRIKNSDDISNIKGKIYIKFIIKEVHESVDLVFNNIKNVGTINFKLKVPELEFPDNSEQLKGENFVKYGGSILEHTYKSTELGKDGKFVHTWTVRLNAKKAKYDQLVVVDEIDLSAAPMQFIPEKFTLRMGDGINRQWQLVNGVELERGKDFDVEYNESFTKMKVIILTPQEKPYMVNYMTTSPADGSDVSNKVKVETEHGNLTLNDQTTVTETKLTSDSTVRSGGTVTIDSAYRIVLYKVDADNLNKLDGATFEVTKPNGQKFDLGPTKNGLIISDAIPEAEAKSGLFTIKEKQAPDGYVLDENAFTLEVGEKGAVKTVTNKKQSVNFTVNKTWEGLEGTAPEVRFQLKRDGQNFGDVKTLASGETQLVWDNLPKYQEGNYPELSVYTVEELALDGYISNIEEIANGANVKNINNKTTFTVNKTWEGLKGAAPEVKFQLKRDGQNFGDVKTLATGETQLVWDNLPKYQDGKYPELSVYTVEEVDANGYISNVKVVAGGVAITNIVNTTTFTVNKTWEGLEGTAPEVRFQLKRDGQNFGEVKTLASGETQLVWDNLPKYQDGKYPELSVYTVEELAVDGFISNVEEIANGANVKNIYNKTSIIVNKTWEDGNNRHNIRPNEITVNLIGKIEGNDNPVVTKTQNIVENNGVWSFTFTDLPKYQDGKLINYTVTENPVDRYSTEINGFEIVNSYIPTVKNVIFSKIETNGTTQLEGATIKLYRGEVLTDENLVETWKTTADKKTIELKEGIYTMVEEEAPAGYEKAENIVFRVTGDGVVEIREMENNAVVWKAVQNGIVEMIDKKIPVQPDEDNSAPIVNIPKKEEEEKEKERPNVIEIVEEVKEESDNSIIVDDVKGEKTDEPTKMIPKTAISSGILNSLALALVSGASILTIRKNKRK